MASSGGAVTLDQAMLDLSYLLGETSVPTPAPVDRQTFIQRTLERIYRSFNFDMNQVIATLTITTGRVTLPGDASLNPKLDVRVKNDVAGKGVGGDFIFTEVPYEQQDSFGNGDYRYWITGTPGAYVVNTTENGNSAVANLVVKYTQVAPVINASISTPFPSSMCIARGALVYYRQAEDPQADVSQIEALFRQELEEVIAVQIRNQPDKPAVTRHQVRGTFIGDVDTPGYTSGSTV